MSGDSAVSAPRRSASPIGPGRGIGRKSTRRCADALHFLARSRSSLRSGPVTNTRRRCGAFSATMAIARAASVDHDVAAGQRGVQALAGSNIDSVLRRVTAEHANVVTPSSKLLGDGAAERARSSDNGNSHGGFATSPAHMESGAYPRKQPISPQGRSKIATATADKRSPHEVDAHARRTASSCAPWPLSNAPAAAVCPPEEPPGILRVRSVGRGCARPRAYRLHDSH
jgi:hypothetical protein